MVVLYLSRETATQVQARPTSVPTSREPSLMSPVYVLKDR